MEKTQTYIMTEIPITTEVIIYINGLDHKYLLCLQEDKLILKN